MAKINIMADSPSKDDQLDEAFAAYLRSCDAGEVASREEFLSQFPDLADELKQLIEAADMIGQVTLTPKPEAPDAGAETLVASIPSGEDSSVAPVYDVESIGVETMLIDERRLTSCPVGGFNICPSENVAPIPDIITAYRRLGS